MVEQLTNADIICQDCLKIPKVRYKCYEEGEVVYKCYECAFEGTKE